MFTAYRRHRGRRIIAQLADGSTIAGVLVRARRRELELGEAAMVTGERRTPIDGTVVIERAAAAWVQVV
ncbi:hypothetical protein [Streptomonospora salina]|uniref:hypothetical protein n=1 Tax=Streptomonospora salina TaxID=104205 RepID=UPI0031F0FA65